MLVPSQRLFLGYIARICIRTPTSFTHPGFTSPPLQSAGPELLALGRISQAVDAYSQATLLGERGDVSAATMDRTLNFFHLVLRCAKIRGSFSLYQDKSPECPHDQAG
jgi:hypothetical protein